MWLLRTDDPANPVLEELLVLDRSHPYAILSHRWSSDPADEISFKDMKRLGNPQTSKNIKAAIMNRPGFVKIVQFCTLAKKSRLKYAWVDTCCIDKRSSSELSEAINSMYDWYQKAQVCIAFLYDRNKDRWLESEWWTRGWTLQELIAPNIVKFYDKEWKPIGDRAELAEKIFRKHKIPRALLVGASEPSHYSVAQRMAWASKRETKRSEDIAYCLLGLFDIQMPLLYGEGKRAFLRLQFELLHKHPDESIFMWSHALARASVLAHHPMGFANCVNLPPIRRMPKHTQSPDAQSSKKRKRNDGAHRRGGLDSYGLPTSRFVGPARVTSWGIEMQIKARKLWPIETTLYDDRIQRYFLEVPLIIASDHGIKRLDRSLILVNSGPTAWSYHRKECISTDGPKHEMELRKTYKFNDKFEDTLVYLHYDADVST